MSKIQCALSTHLSLDWPHVKCSTAHVRSGGHIAQHRLTSGHPTRLLHIPGVEPALLYLRQTWKEKHCKLKAKLLENHTFSGQKTNERKEFISCISLHSNHKCINCAGLFISVGLEINDLKLMNLHIQKVQTAREGSKPKWALPDLFYCH